MAFWTIKGEAASRRGVTSRDEIELALGADTPPALAIAALRQAAASRGAHALAEAVGEGLRAGGLPLARPYLETTTHRRILDLADQDSAVELALDRMRIIGHAYAEHEIEAELKRGDERVLDAVRSAIEALGDVRESDGSKLSRAMRHVAACACTASGG